MRKLIFILFIIPALVNAQTNNAWYWSQLRNSGAPPPPARSNLIFESTFAGITNWQATTLPVQIGLPWGNEQHCCTWSVQSAPASVIQCGQGAIQFEVRRSDPITSGCVRSELTGIDIQGNTDQWHAYSVYIPSSDVQDGTDQSMYQWHQQQSNGVPAQAIWMASDNRWLLSHNTSGDINTPNYMYNDLGAVVKDVWNNFVIHIRTAQNGTGLIQIWVNGAVVYTYNGNVGYPDGAYMKVGIYKFIWCSTASGSATRRAYFGQIRIGNQNATYNDVSPGCY